MVQTFEEDDNRITKMALGWTAEGRRRKEKPREQWLEEKEVWQAKISQKTEQRDL